MRRLKRTIAAILCIFMFVSLFSGLSFTASAAGTGYSRAVLQEIIVETAIAYYLKGPNVQYDSFYLKNGQSYKTDILRTTYCASPEDASPMKRDYTVCSAFIHDVYYNVFGKHIMTKDNVASLTSYGQQIFGVWSGSGGSGVMLDPSVRYNANTLTEDDIKYPLADLTNTGPLAYYTMKKSQGSNTVQNNHLLYLDVNENDQYDAGVDTLGVDGAIYYAEFAANSGASAAEFSAMTALLEPGDVLVPITDTNPNSSGYGGHALIYVGDVNGDGEPDVIHANDRKYNFGKSDFTNSSYSYHDPADTADPNSKTIYGYDGMDSHNQFSRNGAIRLNSYEDIIGDGTTNYAPHGSGQYWPMKNDRSTAFAFAVLRPIDMMNLTMDPNTPENYHVDNVKNWAKSRRWTPGLEITTTADRTIYNDVLPGEQITYSIEVTNDTNLFGTRYNGKSNYACQGGGVEYRNVRITMPLPDNTTIAQDSQNNYLYSVTDGAGTTKWASLSYTAKTSTQPAKVTATGMTITAGDTRRLNVTVTVDPNAQPGDTVTLPQGGVTRPSYTSNEIKASTLTHTVGRTHPTGFATMDTTADYTSGTDNLMDIVNTVYNRAYPNQTIDIGLTGTQDFLDEILAIYYPSNGNGSYNGTPYTRIKNVNEFTDNSTEQIWRKMIVPGYVGGQKLFTSNAKEVRSSESRLLDFNEEFLQPGDILIYAYTNTQPKQIQSNVEDAEKVYVYLGNHQYAFCDSDASFEVKNAPMRAFRVSNGALTEETPFDTYHFSYTINPNAVSAPRIEYSEVLTQAFRYSYFFLLRPSLVYDFANTTGAPFVNND